MNQLLTINYLCRTVTSAYNVLSSCMFSPKPVNFPSMYLTRYGRVDMPFLATHHGTVKTKTPPTALITRAFFFNKTYSSNCTDLSPSDFANLMESGWPIFETTVSLESPNASDDIKDSLRVCGPRTPHPDNAKTDMTSRSFMV